MRKINFQKKVNQVKKKLLPEINCEPIRWWYRDNGERNIIQWLNDALYVSEKM